MAEGKFGTAVNCMDGRVQEQVVAWMKENFGVDHVDMITDPGPDGILACGKTEGIENIRKRVLISVNAHGSKCLAIVGHHDCAGNPCSKEEHLKHIKASLETIGSWDLPLELVGLWINEEWKVEKLDL